MKHKSKSVALCALGPAILMLACGGHTLLGEDSDGQGGQGSGGQATSGGQVNDEQGTGGWANGGLASGGAVNGPGSGGWVNGGLASGGWVNGPGSGGWVNGGQASGGQPSGGQAGGPTCPATCSDAEGEAQSLPTAQDFYSAIVGRWQICSGQAAFPGAPNDVIGVEYGPPSLVTTPELGTFLKGNMYYLVAGVTGPEPGVGFEYHLTYDVSPQEAGSPPQQLNMHPAANSGFGGGFRYSPCPRQWQIDGGSASPSAQAILVPFE